MVSAILVSLCGVAFLLLAIALFFRVQQVSIVVETKRILGGILSSNKELLALLQFREGHWELIRIDRAEEIVMQALKQLPRRRQREFRLAIQRSNRNRLLHEIAIIARCMGAHDPAQKADIRVNTDKGEVLFNDSWVLRTAR